MPRATLTLDVRTAALNRPQNALPVEPHLLQNLASLQQDALSSPFIADLYSEAELTNDGEAVQSGKKGKRRKGGRVRPPED